MSEENRGIDIVAIAKEYGEMLGRGMDPELADEIIRRKYPSLEGNPDWQVMELTALGPLRKVLAEKHQQPADGAEDAKKPQDGSNESENTFTIFDAFIEVRRLGMVGLPESQLSSLATALTNGYLASKTGVTFNATKMVDRYAKQLNISLNETESGVLVEAFAGYFKSISPDTRPTPSEINKRASLEEAALAGDATAMLDLGAALVREEKFTQSRLWLEKSAAAGNAGAMCGLGKLYAAGKGVAYNRQEGLRWIKKAAAAGYPEAMVILEDIDSLQKLALAGDTDAMWKLGVWYDGRKDYIEARLWFEKLSAAGDEDGMCALGKYLRTGKGGPEDTKRGDQLIRKAAEMGHAEGMLILGASYRYARGGESRDLAQAWRWWEKAAAAGNENAKTQLREWNESLEQAFKATKMMSVAVKIAATDYVILTKDKSDTAVAEDEILKKYSFAEGSNDWVVLHEVVFKQMRMLKATEAQTKSSSCFIATAACGSADAPDVETLRRFRDETLVHYRLGRRLVGVYEKLSPPIAARIAGDLFCRRIVRCLIVRPFAGLVKLAVD